LFNDEKEVSMKTVEVIVEHAGNNLSAYIEGAPVITVGNDVKEIEKNMKEAVELYLDSCKEMNIAPVEVLQGEFTLKFKIDAATFINYYSSIFTKAALSRITGINERQLWHYAAGVHKPRKQQLEKIQKGINALTEELAAINLL
jgi:predicted RNase H-like HicB family nuclease